MRIPIASLSHLAYISTVETSAGLIVSKPRETTSCKAEVPNMHRVTLHTMQLSAWAGKKKSCKPFLLTHLHTSSCNLAVNPQFLFSLYPTLCEQPYGIGAKKEAPLSPSLQQTHRVWAAVVECTWWKPWDPLLCRLYNVSKTLKWSSQDRNHPTSKL